MLVVMMLIVMMKMKTMIWLQQNLFYRVGRLYP